MVKKVTVEIEFTERELEVLRLLCDGCEHKDIAEKLGITVRTSRWYVHRFYAKIPVRLNDSTSTSRVRLYKWALEHGLLEMPKRKEHNEPDEKVVSRSSIRRISAA